jgi:hypothetical protein
MSKYICDCCGTSSNDPTGCDCGGEKIPSEPLPAELYNEGPPQAFYPKLDTSRPQTDLTCLQYTQTEYPESFDADEEYD